MTVQDIINAASQLSQEERLQIAIQLLESLKKTQSSVQKSPDSDLSWRSELHPLVQKLVGVIPSDKDPKSLYVDYLEEKYS